MWPGFPAKDETHPNSDAWHWWSPPHNVWIPSYIAYGLVDTITPLYGAMGAMTGSPGLAPEKQGDIQKGHDTGPSTKRSSLGPEEQGFHQEMLRKLALHLAAQPEEVPDTVATAPSPETMVKECPSEPVHFCESNFFMPVDKEEGSDTPRSFCATPEEHGMPVWKDRNADASGYEENEPSHCVCVPSYIVHGLLEAWEGKSKKDRRFGPSEQSFHHEMLRKLALHLAAQPGEPSAQVPQAPAPAPQPKRKPVSAPGYAGLFHNNRPQEEFHRQMLQKLALHLAAQPDSPSHSHPSQAPKVDRSPAPQPGLAPQSHAHSEDHQELLRKLALHLAAQPHPLDQPPVQLEIEPALERSSEQIGEDKAHCERLLEDMDAPERRSEAMSWVLSSGKSLSLTQFGSRVVQKAIGNASPQERETFAEALLPHAMDLYMSPHGNHVLAKLIEVLPSTRLVCIAQRMRGQATSVARHQFGSRILERLMEHCTEEQIGFLLDELFDDEQNLEALARHPFANFVVQHIFEHGMASRKSHCFRMLLPHVLQHATHKTASNVVQRMLEHADVTGQALIADAFLAGEGESSLETIAATRYGSFVVHSLVDKLHPRIDAVKARVKAAHPQLQESKFSQKNILDFLGEAFFAD